ncbi:hypothetical protein D918_03231 [Trichuris suis]|nr:hypothetical protein D918_03231 [Trichuris suis]
MQGKVRNYKSHLAVVRLISDAQLVRTFADVKVDIACDGYNISALVMARLEIAILSGISLWKVAHRPVALDVDD